ncbi:GNAT family N-acetyltransferase [Haloferax volcanii]|uniref:GNAT family acetyltransferase n=3 Tax=Haloferax volcanii TaxID=2246 RepID=A0A384LNG7_HALVD|nr:GNAT family N-acetyltransferase [Haloferax volcanii]ADE05082.1 GNAT family acetyltransferase [Haloferax volcanii DS2]ELY23893.1 GNAT family acetyltransferase [Haloferax volcanii DS2]MBS8118628.1 GNAT family N-acetyltransferase [Haloferax volcanii]MBS8123642.1 GNAT family N-acetyltransferase [Haloferax volcanii]MBS8127511.1 GNAT family N-acetyltransferase [Haloferax volcanii]
MEDTERDRETGGARVREGDPDELVAVMRVLDAGLLEADAGEIRDRLAAGDCLVAEASGRVVGALALDGDYIEAVAVSPSRRGRGVGTQLVRAALDRRGRLVVDFDGGVKPFYESLGFDIEDRSDDEGRFRGVLRDE